MRSNGEASMTTWIAWLRRYLVWSFVALSLVVWWAAPRVEQKPEYHHFADFRPWHGVNNAANVLSNLPMLIVGVAGLIALGAGRGRDVDSTTRVKLKIEAAAFVLTSLGSMYYHLRPDDMTLVVDRLPMTTGFASVLAVALAVRVGDREAIEAFTAWVVLGVASMVVRLRVAARPCGPGGLEGVT
jgi:hypothetical protein